MNKNRPTSNEYAPYYHTYIGKVPEGTLLDLLAQSYNEFLAITQNIDASKEDYRYAEGKWSIKEVLQHLIDTERVMQYRALRVARNDTTPMAGFDQDDFAAVAIVSHRSIPDLMAEFNIVRQSSITLFQSLQASNLLHIGTASGHPVSTRALGYIILGHQLHHQKILVERYL